MRWQAGVTVPAVRVHDAARGDGLDDEGLQTARLGSGELSLADPMGLPPSVVTRRGDKSEGYSWPPRPVKRTYIQERNHVSIMGPGGRTHNCAKHLIPEWQAMEN
jgi:hypothetical protein